jgi:transposase-like protein
MNKEFLNLHSIDYFTTERKCLKYFEKLRWGSVPACTSCGSVNPYKLSDGKNYKCRECKKFFNALTGTLFENTKIPLVKWFKAIYIFTSHKKGISSVQLGKDLGITQKSAWFVNHRLRELLTDKAPQVLEGVVEVDTALIGGKTKNKSKSKRALIVKGEKLDGKSAVLTFRSNGIVRDVIVPTRQANYYPIIDKNVKQGSVIISDEHQSFKLLGLRYNHQIVQHKKDNYVVNGYTTNGVEGYFSHLKRGIYGIYHHASPKHLHRYCNEFAFRYNTRKQKEVERFDNALRQCEGSRLKYPDLIGKEAAK